MAENETNEDVNNEKKQKTVLIFGVSSFLGSNLAEFFKKDYKVIGTYHKTQTFLPGITTISCDVLQKDEVQLILYLFRPDYTIYCAGLSSIVKCHDHENLADALNTSGLFNVTDNCQRYKSQICYVSSAFVFGGDDKDYIEMDIPDSNTVYGKTQAAAEFYVQKSSLNYLIFRTCKMYGRGIHPNRLNWFEVMQNELASGRNLQCDNFISSGHLDVIYLAMVIKLCFEKKVANRLLQVSSSDTMTHYEFSKLYSKIFSESEELIIKTKWPFPLVEGVSANEEIKDHFYFKLDLNNAEGFLNIQMPSIEESLKFTYKRLGGVEEVGSVTSNKGQGIQFI